MSKNYKILKNKAVGLRQNGKSYNEIGKLISVSKSTLSSWLKNIPLKEGYRERFYTNQIYNLSLGPTSQKERRAREIEKIIKEARNEIKKPLLEESFKLFGVALYWGEGSKGGLCQITNSDPRLIAFMVRWFERIFKLAANDFKAYLNIYPQQDELKIKKFWSEITGIPVSRFGKTFTKPQSSGFKKNNLYYGTIKITIPRSVNFKHKIFGWASAAFQNVNFGVKLAKRKWESLSKINRPTPVNLRKTAPSSIGRASRS